MKNLPRGLNEKTCLVDLIRVGDAQAIASKTSTASDPSGYDHTFIYGLVTTMHGFDRTVVIGTREYSENDFDKAINALRKTTGKHYCWSFVEAPEEKIGEESKNDSIAVIGLGVPAFINKTYQSQGTFATSEDLEKVLTQSTAILRDLETIGFTNKAKEDLYLFARA